MQQVAFFACKHLRQHSTSSVNVGHYIHVPAQSPVRIRGIGPAADLNGDGKIDLVGYTWDAGGLRMVVLLGHGDGSFGAPAAYSVNSAGDKLINLSFTLGDVNGSDAVEVQTRRIDDIVGDRRVSFIKMDIEGSEYKALLGARETILQSHPPLLIELNEKTLRACGSSTREVKMLLSDYGYKGTLVNTGVAINIDDMHDCDECLFVSNQLNATITSHSGGPGD